MVFMIYKKKERTECLEDEQYELTRMQKEPILRKLRESGYRITPQRELLIRILMNEECSSCKELYYRAAREDEKIGIATVYRMLAVLERIGVISRKGIQKMEYGKEDFPDTFCTVLLDDDTRCLLSAKKWELVMNAGLRDCGYLDGGKKVVSVSMNSRGQEIVFSKEQENTEGQYILAPQERKG